jgi:predicted HTH domain antitoxin
MSERVVNISFPVKENILLSLKETKDEFAKEVLFLAALVLYRKRKLSLGKAAELAGYKKVAFIEKMQKEEEFIFDYTGEEMTEIFEDTDKIQ